MLIDDGWPEPRNLGGRPNMRRVTRVLDRNLQLGGTGCLRHLRVEATMALLPRNISAVNGLVFVPSELVPLARTCV